MTVSEFEQGLSASAPPHDLSLALQALWYERKGDWHTAHQLADRQDESGGAWVHAYLHRVEGDLSNARYWYRRAGKPYFSGELKKEWTYIVEHLLNEM